MKCKHTPKLAFSITEGYFMMKARKRCETGHSTRLYQMTAIRGGSRLTWKWTKKLFFHLLDPTTVNSCNILTYYGSKLSQTIQADIGEGPTIRARKDASTSDLKTKKTSPIH